MLHLADQETRYQVAQLLPNVTANSVWRVFQKFWIDLYFTTPDIVIHEEGKQLRWKVFQFCANMINITANRVHVECQNKISVFKHYLIPVQGP